MKSGQSIHESYKLYLSNPVIILPYLLLGIFNAVLAVASINYLKGSIASIRFTNTIQLFILGQTLKDAVSALFLKSLLVFLAAGILYLFVDGVVKSYTIGLAAEIAKGKPAKLSDGLKSINRALTIVSKNIALGLLLLFGSGLLFMTSAVLLGKFALIAFIPSAIIYAFIIFATTLFASQSIVLEGKGAWQGIVSGYYFTRKHMEDVAKLVLFLIFVYVSFQMIQLATMRLLENFFLSTALNLIKLGENILLSYIIMRPFFVILKTHFFIKNSKIPNKKD